MAEQRKYYVTTHDPDTGRYTPQKGVRTGPYSLFGLRKALRRLQQMGYEGRRGDPAVRVERDDLRCDHPGLA